MGKSKLQILHDKNSVGNDKFYYQQLLCPPLLPILNLLIFLSCVNINIYITISKIHSEATFNNMHEKKKTHITFKIQFEHESTIIKYTKWEKFKS